MCPWNKTRFGLKGLPALETYCVGLEHELDLVADSAELVENLLLATRCMGRILEAPMEAVHLTWEHRACLIGIPADRDHGIYGPIQKLIKVFGGVSGDIDTKLLHHFDGLRVDVSGRFGACAGDFDEITSGGAEDAFGKVTAAGIARAEDKDERFHGKK